MDFTCRWDAGIWRPALSWLRQPGLSGCFLLLPASDSIVWRGFVVRWEISQIGRPQSLYDTFRPFEAEEAGLFKLRQRFAVEREPSTGGRVVWPDL